MENHPYHGPNYHHFPIIVKQDGNKVFRYLDGAFRILYDFDLDVQDTLKVYNNILYDRGKSKYSYFLIDSVGIMDYNGTSLRFQRV